MPTAGQSKDFTVLSNIPLRQIVEHSLRILKHAGAAIQFDEPDGVQGFLGSLEALEGIKVAGGRLADVCLARNLSEE
ncbi:UNVERIFIED_CONTAM: hypothetical protein Sangu_0900900 [Sesamum angustifolium]|uniref:Uncharacterized protein n=1 Tax=Sesamum angustifolium TaxID=2727405 RepID=A0AAW2PEN5_9LAMI